MIMEGTLYKGKAVYVQEHIESDDADGESYSARLEACLRSFCQLVDAPLPLWMEKNTREYSRYRQTTFYRDQFLEPVAFDRMQIRQLSE